MTALFWIGFATPFVVVLLLIIVCLLWQTCLTLMRLLNRKVGNRFIRKYAFEDEIVAKGDVNHDRCALELAKVLASAPCYRAFTIGPWYITVCHDYRTDRKRNSNE